ncbi:MAG: hypothetical protein JW714_00390 [Candidatus Omnitrophica bacterium]|nr:hypothetical protein [Candidatus Omnitrophota bacterium]
MSSIMFSQPKVLLRALAVAMVWQLQSSGMRDADIRSISVFSQNDNLICAAAKKTLYLSRDRGNFWQEIFSFAAQEKECNFVSFDLFDPKLIYLATTQGLFVTKDQGQAWRQIFRLVNQTASSVTWIALDCREQKKIYIGTEEAVYTSSDQGITWQKSKGGLPRAKVSSLAVHPLNSQILYLANSYGLFKTIDQAQTWKRIYVTSSRRTDNNDQGLEDDAEQSRDNEDQNLINCIAIDRHYPKRIFIGTGKGVFVTDEAGESWERLAKAGLSDEQINFIVLGDKGKALYAATPKGVFKFSFGQNGWSELYQGMTAQTAHSLALNKQGQLFWAGTDQGLFKLSKSEIVPEQNKKAQTDCEQIIQEFFLSEPTIQQVQEAALRYGEVIHPDNIKALRRDARLKALLPTFSVGADRNVTDVYHWEGGSTTIVNDDFLRKGKDIVEWDASLSWNLGDLVFSEQVRLIDSNARLAVQLREDIISEVTRLYYERRKLQTELILTPAQTTQEKLNQTLRLEELTANIDGLTGGYFSRRLKER